ncbi:MAG: hypothetical protein P1U42_01325 [Phycisphaerales bacterium]|nr:hypothetical protein [Phycisphaerales bacterium]
MPNRHEESKNRSRIWSVFLQLLNVFRRTPHSSPYLVVKKDGFDVINRNEYCWSLKWDEVTGVVAYKQAQISTDLICFGFQIGTNADTLWCINEDIPGFDEVVGDITRITAGAWPNRFSDIAVPPFEFNWTELWNAPNSIPIAENPKLLIWKKIPNDLLPTR